MEGTPRGRAIIFVTVDDLLNESLRFKWILEKMFFKVDIHRQLTCAQISDILDVVSNEKHDGDAFIMMFIGHGYDEKIQGWQERDGDELAISKIVDKFSENNCLSLRNKPKIFLFNCCRISTFYEPKQIHVSGVFKLDNNQLVIDLTSIDKNWENENKRTYIIYACAEGTAINLGIIRHQKMISNINLISDTTKTGKRDRRRPTAR
ncbi:unnamed protein product, partial [Oppiella nova]